MGWRYIVQRLTGVDEPDYLGEIPISNVRLTDALSGPIALSGTISPEIGMAIAADGRPLLDEWGSAVWAEADGLIRGGGIVTYSRFNGAQWQLECTGFTGYPTDLPYTGTAYYGVQVDPLDMVRLIWSHIQSQPGGNLNLIVDDTTSPVRIGEELENVQFVDANGNTVSFEAGPYKLAWWVTDDLGREIDNLAKQTPFDYHETHQWADRTPLWSDQMESMTFSSIFPAATASFKTEAETTYTRFTGTSSKGAEWGKVVKVRAGGLYRLRARVRQSTAPTNGLGNTWYAGIRQLDDTGAAVSANAGRVYIAASNVTLAASQYWTLFEGTIAAESLAAGTTWLGATVIGDYPDGNGVADIDYVSIEDINLPSETVTHKLELGYPSIGRRRHDLRFVVGENVMSDPEFVRDGELFANYIHVLGAGEGQKMIRAYLGSPDGRLRRVAQIASKDLRSKASASSLGSRELSKRKGLPSVDQIVVRDHPNAPIGSWQVGDEVNLIADTGWIKFDAWVRILASTISPDSGDAATLSVLRTDLSTL